MEHSEVEMLVQSAERWFAQNEPHTDRVSTFEKGNHATASSWSEMAEMGWLGLTLPEHLGGFGASMTAAFALLRRSGRDARPEPIGLHLLLAPYVAAALPDTADALMSGTMRIAMADRSSHAGSPVLKGGRLTGSVQGVEGIADATHVLIPADDEGSGHGAAALVALTAPGVASQPARYVDGRASALLNLRDVPAVRVMPADRAVDLAAAAQVADASGVLEEAFLMTLEYLKQREQFGKPLASQQALQHRMAEVFCDLQQQLALAGRLALELDAAPHGPWPSLAVAKSYVARRVLRAAGALIQVSGGIAVTEEYRLTHLYRRLHVAAQLYGTPEEQLARIDARALLRPS
ncbi:acyl-CoA dehydrogenase family protein [Diaphorobacter caeni]|uniref:acyl-CoA dehydrogenase family protein n=1 Tax=Diaphorobacter caeni TaxID=2784387 RepID=UPI00188E8D5D|nr:acyl-CoA dehydrogenase family protein [Diaphorobacter caeni]MBF5007262.1 acyl-CoA/acyl-ACP dehydrogenase [Diaphorobacter caeni]